MKIQAKKDDDRWFAVFSGFRTHALTFIQSSSGIATLTECNFALAGIPSQRILSHTDDQLLPFMRCRFVTVFISILALLTPLTSMGEPLIIAHRGASAYLPEHTFEAYLLAHGQGADFIEPDLVMTADNHLIALHDLTLEATTNVAERFPNRQRDDGRFYTVDFSLDEIRQLNVTERQDPETGQLRYPLRWQPAVHSFRIVELQALLTWLKELNRTTGRTVGIYPETKFPAFHAANGKDIAKALTDILVKNDLPSESVPVFIQSFEPEPLQSIRSTYANRFQLIQLIGLNEWNMNHVDYDELVTPAGLRSIASYADGIGPPLTSLIGLQPVKPYEPTDFLKHARSAGLKIHPFTFRREGLPAGIILEDLLQIFIHDLAVDGVFTDNPDVAVQARSKTTRSAGE
ncbi:MAG: glycerophosphodiester phosphodiesterase [Wenzhouxiangella sp.]|jgi:glycerophosphoryl diester phosphodiesterase|nr:glycerophosphodiester phosphodiesterase [Wenzhouxiangella sp.]